MIRFIPMVEWETALYDVFKNHIVGYDIYVTVDPIFPGNKPPAQWVEIGAYTCIPASAKQDIADYRVTSTIHAYCEGQFKQDLNDMLNDIVQAASYGMENSEFIMENFICHSVEFAMIEAFEVDFENGEAGQHGVVRIVADLQQKYI